jgi:Heterokaryon incompatibility protein (HET)
MSSKPSEDGSLKTSECSLPEYIYQPLLPQQIRLVHVTKESSDLSIVHTNISSAPPYTAVSYTWNHESPEKYFLIDGSRLKVIPNIVTALPHLTRNTNTNYLWIDGICINQEDEAEKEVQIPLMGDIYTLCSSCLIWLGDSTPYAEIALDSIPRLAKTLQGGEDASKVWEMEGISVRSENVLETPLWKGLVDIFSRPWFKRVWTFQEGVLPPKILFLWGSRIVPLDDIENVAFPLLDHLTALQNSFPNAGVGKNALFVGFLKLARISRFRKSRQETQKALDTLRLLYFTNCWSVSNKMDKIYGVLGLTDQSFQQHLVIDYAKSKAEVSREIVDWYIKHGEDLFFLNMATSNTMGKRIGLPLWIPNFTGLGSHWGICIIWHRFRAGMIDKKPFSGKGTKIIEGELHVEGLQVDEVSHIIPDSDREFQTQAEKYRKILEWENACLTASKLVFSSPYTVPEAHWTTIISAICNNRLKPVFSEYLLLKTYLQGIVADIPLSPELETRRQDLLEQIRRIYQTSTRGRFYCTRDGRVGIGPGSTLTGDQICVLYNGFTPFILRATSGPEARKKWKFIGDSYTWGIMDGEVFQEPRRQDKTFVLV